MGGMSKSEALFLILIFWHYDPDQALVPTNAGFGNRSGACTSGLRLRIRRSRGYFLSPAPSHHQAISRAGPRLLSRLGWRLPIAFRQGARQHDLAPPLLKVFVDDLC